MKDKIENIWEEIKYYVYLYYLLIYAVSKIKLRFRSLFRFDF